MRFLFATLGSYGDVFPLLTMGKDLQERGHSVTIVANPLFHAIVNEAGLSFLPLGVENDYFDEIQNPDIWHPTRGFRLVVEYGILRMLKPLYEIINQFDPLNTVIVSSALLLGSHIAHDKHGYRFCTFHLQPGLIRSLFAPPVLSFPALPELTPAWMVNGYYCSMDRFFIDPLLRPINDFRKQLGLPKITRFFNQWIHSPQLNLGLFPEWFAPLQNDWPINTRLTGFIPHVSEERLLSSETISFLQKGPPPLVFTAGTAMLHTEEFFQTAIQATRKLNLRAILLTRLREQLPAQLPEFIHQAAFEPLQELLTKSSALIYHGGIGSLAQALAAGVPQLVMPMSLDQPDNAARIKKLGVGDFVMPNQFKPNVVAGKLDLLLNNPIVHEQCCQLAGKVDFGKARSETCDLLEKFAANNLEQR